MGSAVASLICADVFPGSLNSKSNTDIVIAMIGADAVKLTQSGLGDTDSDSQSVNRTTLFSLFQTNFGTITRITDKSLLNVLLQSLASKYRVRRDLNTDVSVFA